MEFLAGSFKVGRLFDIDIRVHILFVVWAAFRLFQDPTLMGLTFLLMIYGIVLAHEYGHCFGARSVGGEAHVILLWPLGGIAYPRSPMRPWNQFVSVAAGPAVNVLFCILSAIAMFILGGGVGVHFAWGFLPFVVPQPTMEISLQTYRVLLYIALFYQLNLVIFAFNMLPVFPMDGGQILRAVLWPWLGLQRATVLACQIGIGGAVVFGVMAVRNNEMFMMFLALFIGYGCVKQLQYARYGMLVEDDRFSYDNMNYGRRENFWQRAWKRRPKLPKRDLPSDNPNPGAWQARQEERAKEEAELDRILRKVKDEGLHSLSYIEQQKLKNATRQRQQEERDFDRRNNL